MGERSPSKYGRKISPSAPAGMLLAAASKALGEPTSKSFCAQLTHLPAQRIAPKTEKLLPSSVQM